MRADLLVLVGYAALLFLLAPSSAIQYTIAAALLGAAVTWATRAAHFLSAFLWFRTRLLSALALLALVAVFAFLPFVIAPLLFGVQPAPIAELPFVLVTTPVVLLWFWLFLAIGARFQESRDAKLIAAALAARKRDTAESGDNSAGH
ncbi:hypothetical protein HZ992_15010 [Rhizobacter sp. AJA081-3]|uniref:hypothetical protein n=1 Tax=Rhizobacter sp. AJA081-3 TaxID=2753607 RepID=UPI001ADF20F5|nr:hypothetical protein [Rhizobacter sp. AJA081-3]QTN21494.1 hypothetical protein HZ992_15010 [Rhizobacter sp. AJA081-3]